MYEGIDLSKLGAEIESFVDFFDENKALFSKNVLTQPLVPYDVHLLTKAYINSKYGFSLETEPAEVRALETYQNLINSIPDEKEKSVSTEFGVEFKYFDSKDLKG
ncbi:hypothetical protein ACNE9Y_32260, partial [Pseudomonas sp. NY11226]